MAEAARCLILVGAGSSLREASQTVRFAAGRYRNDRLGLRRASREDALAADYLDHFGPVIVERLRPARWPAILLLSSQRLDSQGSSGRPVRAATVFVALGADETPSKPHIWLASLGGDESARSWSEFLSRLPLVPAPRWIVADTATMAPADVAAIWPTAVFYPSETHLRLAAKRRAMADGLLTRPAFRQLIDDCFGGPDSWRRLGEAVRPFERSISLAWWLRTDAEARRMAELAIRAPGYPRDSSAADRVAEEIARRLRSRAGSFRNGRRLDTIVQLMAIDLAGRASEARYRKLLNDYLASVCWSPRNDWEAGHDLYGRPSSLNRLLLREPQGPGVARDPGGRADLRATDRGRISIPGRARGQVVMGRPPSDVRTARRRRPAPAVTLVDLPELLAEWDRERNDALDPASLDVSLTVQAHWICSEGHRWQASLFDRGRGLAPCRTCNRKRVDASTSLAAVCPDLLDEWDVAANGRKSPDRTRATSRIVVVWRCGHDGHAPFRMSPAARVDRFERNVPGCRTCRARARSVRPNG